MQTIKQSEPLLDYWGRHIQSWQQTGKTQSSYCRTHDLNYHRFTYWRRKLSTPGKGARQAVIRSGFVAVKPASQVSTNLIATLPNGVILQGICTDNLSVVKQLLGLAP